MHRLRARRGFTLIELMLVVGIMGLLTTLAIPRFLALQARAKQSEARSHLKAVYAAQKAHFSERDRYASDFRALGFAPEPGNRYSYGLGTTLCNEAVAPAGRNYAGGCIGQDVGRVALAPSSVGEPVEPDSLGIQGSCPACSFTATAVANLDGDEQGDTWAISSRDSLELINTCGNDTSSAGAGEPANAYNDAVCP